MLNAKEKQDIFDRCVKRAKERVADLVNPPPSTLINLFMSMRSDLAKNPQATPQDVADFKAAIARAIQTDKLLKKFPEHKREIEAILDDAFRNHHYESKTVKFPEVSFLKNVKF